MSAVAPMIEEITKREFNTSDSITCTAMGVPEPTVTWTHIAGSMPKTATTSGPGIAVLRNLQNGVHTWMCTASSQMGSDSYNVTFTGEFCTCSVLTSVCSEVTAMHQWCYFLCSNQQLTVTEVTYRLQHCLEWVMHTEVNNLQLASAKLCFSVV